MPQSRAAEPTTPKVGNRGRQRAMARRAVISGTLGQALEFFDFALYGALSATLFPKLFFSGLGESGGLLASFATFGVGFVARPLGAIVFGHLGDKFGRRPILFGTLLAMAVSSVVIGLLPAGGGVAVAAILVALRFVQGFSLGGESTGNQLMAMEHVDRARRGVLGSFVNMGSPISQVAANLVLAVLTATLSEQQWESWGWRLPFLASIILVAVAAFIRLKIDETPAFSARQEETSAKDGKHGLGIRVLVTQPREILRLALAWGGPTISFYLIAVYGLDLLKHSVGFSSSTTFTVLLIANAVSVAACYFGGRISDRIGRKRAVLIGLTGCIIGVTLFFALIQTAAVVPIALAVTFTLCSIQLITGVQPAFFSEQFPTQSRYFGSACAYTLSTLVFAAPTPIVAAALTDAGGSQTVLWLTLGVLAASVVAMLTVTDHTGTDLTGTASPVQNAATGNAGECEPASA